MPHLKQRNVYLNAYLYIDNFKYWPQPTAVERVFLFLARRARGSIRVKGHDLEQAEFGYIIMDHINCIYSFEILNVFSRALGELVSVTFHIDLDGKITAHTARMGCILRTASHSMVKLPGQYPANCVLSYNP